MSLSVLVKYLPVNEIPIGQLELSALQFYKLPL